jgi:thioredoxin 1
LQQKKLKNMLYTNLNHIENAADFSKSLTENEKVVIICGRMDASSVQVYRNAADVKSKYWHVEFFDLEYDNPVSAFFHAIPEVAGQNALPLTVCFKNGKVEKVATGSLSESEMVEILDDVFEPATV